MTQTETATEYEYSQTAKPQVFIDTELSELRSKVEEYHERGWRYVNICGTALPDGQVELIYSFSDGLPLENLRVVVDTTTEVQSISDIFPNSFFFENETHDLFGVQFAGISIDFDGEFYTVSVPTPMNPRSSQAVAAVAEGAGSVGAEAGAEAGAAGDTKRGGRK
ncbi:MAG: NADH-quinone oxidoreductase subunit C [Coriobacteriales bacterium]|jgi:hypothetical protein|nr:NADH-quinone oxidoreductase subunit C [Coriobacteriales bacterium]